MKLLKLIKRSIIIEIPLQAKNVGDQMYGEKSKFSGENRFKGIIKSRTIYNFKNGLFESYGNIQDSNVSLKDDKWVIKLNNSALTRKIQKKCFDACKKTLVKVNENEGGI